MHKHHSAGFTLVELSIVLVVIGLIVAGIVLAQSLIRTSKVQTIVSDVSGFQSAITQFRQKYNEIPGDMADAKNYWGTNPNCAVAAGTGTGTQTCNGNGDGQIAVSGSAPYEQFLVWQHLANGGFISDTFTGTSVSGATAPTIYCSPGGNCPSGQVNQAQTYFLQYAPPLTAASYYWDQSAGHYLIIGARGSLSSANGYPAYPLLSALEAYALDGKVDDGLPGQGVWKSYEATGGGGYLPKCVVTSGTTNAPADGTAASAASSVYYIGYGTTPACSFLINMNF